MHASCSFYPTARTPQLIARAEELGYHRAWCYDSPAVCADVWMTLALAAQRTSRIGLAPGVLVPHLRHVVVTAAAVSTLAQLAPGRVAVAVGSGFSASRLLGRAAMRWAEVEAYVLALRGLLAGEAVEHDGTVLRLCHPDGAVAPAPLEVPIVIGAEGPRGLEVARRLGTGVSSSLIEPPAGFDESVRVLLGTVLEDDEEPTADRVHELTGPLAAVLYHGLHDFGRHDDLRGLPGGAEWLAAAQTVPERERHLAIHDGHAYALNAVDRAAIPPGAPAALTFTGTRAELAERLDALEEAGVTEVSFHVGRDAERELEAFADLALR